MSTKPAVPVRILMTGFGPFPGVPANASERIVLRAAELPLPPRIALFTGIIPVSWADARDAVREAVAETQPHAILHFGVSRRVTCFEVETRAFNLSGPKPDAAGAIRPGEPLDMHGERALEATLAPARLIGALRRGGHPARISRDAGRYLCNAVLYWSLRDAGAGAPLTAFVHLPVFDASNVKPRLSLEAAVSGARSLVLAAAEAVVLAGGSGNSKRGGSTGYGSQALHGTWRPRHRAVRQHRR